MANSHYISVIFEKQDTNCMYTFCFCKNIYTYLDMGKRVQKRISKNSGKTLMISPMFLILSPILVGMG